MTSITRNLPWFIRDPSLSIIGEKCYTSLVENLTISDVHCLKYTLSKGLGVGIVAGGSIMKLPQLLLILRGRSARGLSLSSYILETLAYSITSTYSIRNEFPFSTYGENVFLTMQNVAITMLIIYYPPTSLHQAYDVTPWLTYAFLATIACGIALFLFPNSILAFLQLCTLPISVLSKFPQIRQNARAKSTGQLSLFAVASQVIGCLARLFTTATEVGDAKLTAGFALTLTLNSIVAVQMWMYWGKDEREKEGTVLPLRKARLRLVGSQDLGRRMQIVVESQSPVMATGPGWEESRIVRLS